MEPVYSPRNAGKILGVTTITIQVWDREKERPDASGFRLEGGGCLNRRSGVS
ncbi:MAG: hypothetical protein QXV32_05025 [Conexivisphaerales archaeon]